MKRVVKSRSRLVKPLAYRPQCERLEVRSQPGSILTNIGAAAGASLADMSQDAAQAASTQASVISFGLANLNSQLHNTTSMQGGGVVGSPSTIQVTNVVPSAPVQLNLQSGFTAQQQAQAVSVANPVGTHGATLSTGNGHTANTAINSTSNVTPVLASQTADVVHFIPATINAVSTSSTQAASNVQTLASGHVFSQATTDFNAIYTSYLGIPGVTGPLAGSAYNSVKGQPDSTAIVGGSVVDPNTGVNDGLIEQISNDGSTVLGFQAIGVSDGSAAISITGADKDNTGDGAIYFSGTETATDGSGTSQLIFGRVESNFSALDYALNFQPFSDGSTVVTGTSAKVNNGKLFLSGNVADATTGVTDVFAAVVSNLQNDPNQLILNGGGIGFQDGSGNAIATTAQAVSGDAAGDIATGGTYALSGNPDTQAFSVAITGGLTSIQNFGLGFITGIQNNGQYTSVDVDNSGPGGDAAVYAAGSSFFHDPAGSPDHFVQIFSKYDGATGSGLYINPTTGQPVGAWLWELQTQAGPFLNWFATGNHADGNGTIHAALGYLTDPADPTMAGSVTLFRVNANGNMPVSTDAFPLNAPFSSGDDRSTGMDIGPDIISGGVDYYLVGNTNGTDFSTTSSTFQQNYPGDPANPTYQGWISDGFIA